MDKPSTQASLATIDLDQVLIPAVQAAQSAARRHGVRLLFDYQGPSPCILAAPSDSTPTAIRLIVDHLAASAIRQASEESITLCAMIATASDNRALLCLIASNVDLGTRRFQHGEGFLETVREDLQDRASTLTLAANLCAGLAGRFDVSPLGTSAWVARAEIELNCIAVGNSSQGTLARVAWLVGSPPRALEDTARRLRRHGWALRVFESADQVLEAVRATEAKLLPKLVLGALPLGVRRNQIAAISAALPQGTDVVWMQDACDPSPPPSGAGISTSIMPISELRLVELSRLERQGSTDGPLPVHTPISTAPLVLVVDDNELNRVMAVEMLHQMGFSVATAADGYECVDRCLTTSPRAVLMDLRMPHLNGFGATRKIRQLQRDGIVRNFPVLAYTAEYDTADGDALDRSGLDAVLPKPIDMRGLGVALHRHMASYERI